MAALRPKTEGERGEDLEAHGLLHRSLHHHTLADIRSLSTAISRAYASSVPHSPAHERSPIATAPPYARSGLDMA
eukprot:1533573-Rhodomonas_salina.1